MQGGPCIWEHQLCICHDFQAGRCGECIQYNSAGKFSSSESLAGKFPHLLLPKRWWSRSGSVGPPRCRALAILPIQAEFILRVVCFSAVWGEKRARVEYTPSDMSLNFAAPNGSLLPGATVSL